MTKRNVQACTGEEGWCSECLHEGTMNCWKACAQAKEIEDFLNEAREQINKEAGVELMPYKAKVIFTGKAQEP